MEREVIAWLERLGLGSYRDAFDANEIAFVDLPELTEDDLKEMGLPIGPRRRALKAIAELDPADASKATPPTITARAADRRQLTVMFCDLVGSTALSERLDPEDLRRVLRRYQDAVAGAVTRFQGHVAQYLGDGILAYFGWPQAYEDQAERAVRAGLDAVGAVRELQLDGETLQARVGIASGRVVVGNSLDSSDLDIQEVSGETPNLAARLQGIAEPGQVVINEVTRLLIGTAFDLVEMGRFDLKGFSSPVPAWRVSGESTVESRFEATRRGALTGLVGRENELGLLQARWQTARNGEGQAMLLSGEAGIGKSRLVRALREKIGREDHFHLGYQCSPHRANSAHYPIIQRLERSARFSATDNDATRLDKLEALLRPTAVDLADVASIFAALLSLPGESRYGPLELTPPQLRDRTVAVLIEQLLALGRLKPVLFVLEDAHWVDPSTSALVQEILARTVDAAVFVLVTFRPEFAPPWTGFPHLASMALSRLNRTQGTEIAREVGGPDLSATVMERIVERAGGVPLYVEELVKMVAESAGSAETLDSEHDIPQTLQDSLMARLDRLGDARHIAQLGAVIGREFSYDLVATLAETSAAALDKDLAKVVASGLASCKGAPPNAVYTFKHALIQDAAYQSLLIARRGELHRRAGAVLEERRVRMDDVAPEIIAYHYSRGGDRMKAAEFWIGAAQRAARSSASQEAISHFKASLAELEGLDESEERTATQLAAWVGLGPLLMATQGVGSAAVVEAYEIAGQLAEKAQDGDQMFRSKFNIWHVNNVVGDCRSAKAIADDLLLQCNVCNGEHDNEGRLLQASHASWSTAWARGNLDECRRHLERGAEIYDRERFGSHKFIYAGHDPGVCCHMFSSWLSTATGDVDAAIRRTENAFVLSEQVEHPYSTTVAHLGAALSMRFLGLKDAQREYTAAGIALCEAHGLMAWLPILKLSQATLATRHADREAVEAGIRTIAECHDAWTGAGAGMFSPWFEYEMAAAELAIGDLAAAGDHLEQAKRGCERNDERWIEPDILRLEASLQEASGSDPDTVSHLYAAAERSARDRGARLAGRKASVAHARFLARAGNREKAKEVLQGADTVIDSAGRLPIHEVERRLRTTLS